MSGLKVVDFKRLKELFYALTGEENGVSDSQDTRGVVITSIRAFLDSVEDSVEVLSDVDNGVVTEFALSAGVHDSVRRVMLKNVVDLFLNSDSESVVSTSVEVEEADKEIQESADEKNEVPDWLQEMRSEEPDDELEEPVEQLVDAALEPWDREGIVGQVVEAEFDGPDVIDDRVRQERRQGEILRHNTIRFIYSKWGGRINTLVEATLDHQIYYVLWTLSISANPSKLLRKLGKDLKALAAQVGVVREKYVSDLRYRNAIADRLEFHLRRLVGFRNVPVPEVWPLRKRTRFWGWIRRSWRRVIKTGVVVFGVWGFSHISIFVFRFLFG